MLSTQPQGRCVYVVLRPEIALRRAAAWRDRFAPLGLTVETLTGDASSDLRRLERARIVVSTATHWDMISRRWKQRKPVQAVSLFIVDELHLIGGADGPILEIVTSRMRYVAAQTERPVRIVGLAASVANAKELGDWIGASPASAFSFHPNVRPVPLDLSITTFDVSHFASRMLAMAKPAYSAVAASGDSPAILFVPSRKQTQLTAIDLVAYASAAGNPSRFCHAPPQSVEEVIADIRDPALKETLANGVGFIHHGLAPSDRRRVEAMVREGAAQCLVMPTDMCWEADVSAKTVIVMGTEVFDGREHRHVDLPITDLLQMAGQPNQN
jgi:pre-mRNA-splicing helicase BRR2